MGLIIYLLVCYGICNNIIYGSIFDGFRSFLSKFGTGGYSVYKLFTCFMCLGTWVGFVVSYIFITFNFNVPVNTSNIYLTVFFNGLLSAGGVWFIHTMQEFFERSLK